MATITFSDKYKLSYHLPPIRILCLREKKAISEAQSQEHYKYNFIFTHENMSHFEKQALSTPILALHHFNHCKDQTHIFPDSNPHLKKKLLYVKTALSFKWQ